MCLAVFVFVGCDNDDRKKISFIANGNVYETVRTNGYETITMPEDPVKKDYVFEGWYWDTEWQREFGETAFEDEALLVNIKVYAKFVKQDPGSITNVTLSNSLKTIKAEQFAQYSSLQSITIPKSVRTIRADAFLGCDSLTRVDITDLDSWCKIEFETPHSNPLFYAKNLYLNGELITDLVIPDTVKIIHEYAFYGGSFKSLTISNSVTEINKEAFKKCTELESVTMGNSVKRVYYDNFKNCNALKRVDITSIGSWLNIYFSGFDANPLNYAHKLYLNNNLVTDLVVPDSVQRIRDCAFKDYTDLKSVVIGNGVKQIDQEAFDGCTFLENVTLGNAVTEISFYAFRNTAIKDITIPDSVERVYRSAFGDCRFLESATIGNSVKDLSDVFKNCYALTKLNITNLENWCNMEFMFWDSSPLYYADNLYLNGNLITDLVIPNTVTKINKHAFYNCESLKSVTIPDSVKTIGEDAFSSCSSLEFVDLGNSLASIDNDAFSLCSSLKDIIIPTTLTNIGSYSFSTYKSFNIFYLGTENALYAGYVKNYFKNSTMYYYSETQPTTEGNFWHFVDDKPTIWASSVQ